MECLIESVRRYPCLWNTTAVEYRDQELKDAAWADVVKETDLCSVKEVKLKWKKLRDSYRDALKRQSDMLARDPANATKKNYAWKYMGLMQFLQPHMNARKKAAAPPTTINGHSREPSATAEPSTEDSESEAEGVSSPKRKYEQLSLIDRKLDFLCRAQSKRQFTEPDSRPGGQPAPAPGATYLPTPPDPLDMFFTSMCQSTKRFPYHTQIRIKKALFSAVIEAEKSLIAEQQNYASLWARGPPTSSSSEGGDAAAPDEEEEEDRKPS